ncbi:MAG: MCP four helix bundle domain-containing protein, partial [Mucilaginibacter sp.]
MLNKFSASSKLYMLIFITAASLIGLGFYGIYELEKMNANTRALYADRVLCIQQLSNVRFRYV